MIEREYRIRKLSDGSGYVVIIMCGLHDVETLPQVFAKQREAREAIMVVHRGRGADHSQPFRGKKPLIICE